MYTEKMTVICNIQAMQKKINSIIPFTFEELEFKYLSELRHLQDEMIILYNETVNREGV